MDIINASLSNSSAVIDYSHLIKKNKLRMLCAGFELTSLSLHSPYNQLLHRVREPWVSALGHLVALRMVVLLANTERGTGVLHVFRDRENGNEPAVVIIRAQSTTGHNYEWPPVVSFAARCRFFGGRELPTSRGEETLSTHYFM